MAPRIYCRSLVGLRQQGEALIEPSTGSLVAFHIYLHAGIELKVKALQNRAFQRELTPL